MFKGAAVSPVDVVVEGILDSNSWIGSTKLGVHLNDSATVVETLLVCNITEPLDANSHILFQLSLFLSNR